MTTPGKRWWWIAFHDPKRPKGRQSRGVVVIEHAGGYTYALSRARELGIAPTDCEHEGGMVDPAFGDPPAFALGKLMSNAQAELAATAWAGGVATADDIAAAFLDDNAKEGEPLFPRRGPR
jgi:hypothetical protein